VGTGSRVSEGCTIAGPSSIERDCHIDCATLIDGALVLQGTYVGVALDVRRAIVGDEKLFNLERNVEVTISDARLVGRSARPVGFLAGLTSLLRSQAPAGD
jgi:ADP-glucose pyrophosphorylase